MRTASQVDAMQVPSYRDLHTTVHGTFTWIVHWRLSASAPFARNAAPIVRQRLAEDARPALEAAPQVRLCLAFQSIGPDSPNPSWQATLPLVSFTPCAAPKGVW